MNRSLVVVDSLNADVIFRVADLPRPGVQEVNAAAATLSEADVFLVQLETRLTVVTNALKCGRCSTRNRA